MSHLRHMLARSPCTDLRSWMGFLASCTRVASVICNVAWYQIAAALPFFASQISVQSPHKLDLLARGRQISVQSQKIPVRQQLHHGVRRGALPTRCEGGWCPPDVKADGAHQM
eukprot:1831024-Pleurochrysis_carterae.AAC.1